MTIKKLKSGWYNKKLKKINPKDEEIGAILYVTKDFNSLKKFLKNLDNKKIRDKISYYANDLIIDVFDGWCDTTIKVYAKVDYKKRHEDYLKLFK